MRRLVFCTACGLLVLAGCRQQGALQPSEVLQRATAANATLESGEYAATVDFSGEFDGKAAEGNGTLRGVLAHSGQQATLSANIDLSMTDADETTDMKVEGDVVKDTTDVYVFLKSLNVTPSSELLQGMQSLLGKWWRIPGDESLSTQAVTPDAGFLRGQAEAVVVTEDMGIHTIHGTDAYRYSVTLDPEKLIAVMKAGAEKNGEPFDAAEMRTELAKYDAAGELWIDAETFVIHKIIWNVQSKEGADPLTLHFDIEIDKHNAAGSVTIPVQSEEFQPEQLLQLLFAIPGASSF